MLFQLQELLWLTFGFEDKREGITQPHPEPYFRLAPEKGEDHVERNRFAEISLIEGV